MVRKRHSEGDVGAVAPPSIVQGLKKSLPSEKNRCGQPRQRALKSRTNAVRSQELESTHDPAWNPT